MPGESADPFQNTPENKVALFGFSFDKITFSVAVARVLALVDGPGFGHYVVTPNLDHAVVLYQRPELSDVYKSAALVLADGQSLVWASRWFGRPLPERVTGSDLVPMLFEAAHRPLRVFLLGARSGIAAIAGRHVEARFPRIQIVGVHSPPQGFENDIEQNEEAVNQVARTSPDILVVGLGAPKQELWTYRERHRLSAKVILCAGATIDFLAGMRARAPVWCQRSGLEWAFRTLEEPRRLAPRYATDAIMLPMLLLKQAIEEAKRVTRK